MITKKALIIHHSEDNDGTFSAAIVQKFLRDILPEKENNDVIYDITLLGLNYNQVQHIVNGDYNVPMKWSSIIHDYDKVIMVDISFPLSYMKDLADAMITDEDPQAFVWIDHHAPIINAVRAYKNLDTQIAGIRETNHSALYHAWNFFIGGEMPELLDMLSQYDSWTFAPANQDYVTAINTGVTAMTNIKVESAAQMLNRAMDGSLKIFEVQMLGTLILVEQDRTAAKIVESNGDTNFTVGDLMEPACLVIYPGQTSSRFFKSLKYTCIKRGIVLKRNSSGEWSLHLYNINEDDDFHCGEYLRENYNGGGHKGATGCVLTLDQLKKIFETRHI